MHVFEICQQHGINEAVVNSVTATFRGEFPGQEPELTWLAEAANIHRIDDPAREHFFEAVRMALREHRTRDLEVVRGYRSTPDGDPLRSYRRLRTGDLSLRLREFNTGYGAGYYTTRYYRATGEATEGFDPKTAQTDPRGVVWEEDHSSKVSFKQGPPDLA